MSVAGPCAVVLLPDAWTAPAPQSSGGRPTQLEQSRAAITTLRGRWHEIPYRTAAGEAATYHVVDAELLASWLRHPHFRMVK